MRSTFYGLEIAKTGLFTAQNQLDLTSHNMSNANTTGYTRQRFVTQAIPPQNGDFFVMQDMKSTAGRGTATMYIEQVRNPFLDYQYRKENSKATMWTTQEQYFGYVEALFNSELDEMDVSSGLTSTFTSFYNSLYDLIENAGDRDVRNTVLESTEIMTEAMRMYYNKLIEQQNGLDESIKTTVSEINDIAKQISLLNTQIYGFELNGARANDLRDQRNLLIDTLSGLVNIETSEDDLGRLTIKVGDVNLVKHGNYKQMAVNKDVQNNIPDESNVYGIYWALDDGSPSGYDVQVNSGALQGYKNVRDGNNADNIAIPYIVKQLNEVCAETARRINELHVQGYTIPDSSSANQAEWKTRQGILFFKDERTLDGSQLTTPGVSQIKWEGPLSALGEYRIDTIAGTPPKIQVYDQNGNALLTAGDPPVPTPVEITASGVDLTKFGLGKFIVTGTVAAADMNKLADDIEKFGVIKTSVTAKNFFVSDDIKNNINNIATSDMPVLSGSNSELNNAEIALKICALVYNKDKDGIPDNLNGMYRQVLNSISLQMKHIMTTTDTELVMKAHIETQRLSISSVSLDEEMTNLVRFGHSYSAASRCINAMDEQLDKLINGTGMVGR